MNHEQFQNHIPPMNNEYYHHNGGARNPIEHCHRDINDKVRVDEYDRYPGYLIEKISATNGIDIGVTENGILISAYNSEFPNYRPGIGIDSDLLNNSSIISISSNYATKDYVDQNFASIRTENLDYNRLLNMIKELSAKIDNKEEF